MTKKEAKLFFDQKIPQLNVGVNQYWLVGAEDYHEFGWYEINYKKAGLDVKYEELGWRREYLAIFWIGDRPDEYISKLQSLKGVYD